MTYLLVPNGFQDPAENPLMRPIVWVGAIDEEVAGAGLTLDFEAGQQVLGNWRRWPTTGTPRIRCQRLVLSGLAPRAPYNLRLLSGAQTLADAQITTLPDRLPVKGIEKAFTVFLGSCF